MMPKCTLALCCALLAGCERTAPDWFQGYVEGEYVYVASQVGGELRSVEVVKGQTVAAGAPLYRLDPNPEALRTVETRHRLEQARAKLADIQKGARPSELAAIEARLTRARAALERAQRDHQRRLELFELGRSDAVSAEELDRFRIEMEVKQADADAIAAELKTARLGAREDVIAAAESEVGALTAALEQLTWQVDEKQVVAPTAGIVQDVLYREGEVIAAGRPAISLLPPANVKVRFFVPQARLPSITVGDTVHVQLDGIAGRIAATVSFVAIEAEFTPPVIYSKDSRTKLVFMIEALPEAGAVDRLHPGQPLEVHLD